MRPDSIRARMTLAFAAAIAVLLLLACGALTLYARRNAEGNADRVLRETTARMRHELTEPGEDLARTLAELGASLETDNAAVSIVDASGRVRAASRRVVPRWPRAGDDGWRVAATPLPNRNTLVVGVPWEATENALGHQALLFLLLSAFVTGIGAAGAWVLVGRTLRPIGLLAGQAQTAALDGAPPRLEAPSPDAEVVHLVETLNALLARVEQTARAKGRFYAAASHELRTPLQALSGHLEVALSKPRTSEEYRATIAEAQQQTGRLISLVRDLLLLNQLDAAPTPPPGEPVEVAEICERVLARLRPLAETRKLQLEADLPPGETITAPPLHVEMLARNLIENAIQYAEPGGAVRLHCGDQAGTLRLEIFNTFPPLPRLNVEPLFEPFFRPDASRTARTGGNGLGLAICRAIAAANNWDLTLTHEEAGVRATVIF